MQSADRYRRSRGAVVHWIGAQAVCVVWPSAQRIPISVDALRFLEQLSDWTTPAEVLDRMTPGGYITLVAVTIALLLTLGLV